MGMAIMNFANIPLSWVDSRAEVRATLRCGKGLFVCKAIRGGELIVLLGGGVMLASEEEGDFGVQISESHVLATPPGYPLGAADFINHSCDPTVGFYGQIGLVAMRDITADEEITFDYAMCLHSMPGIPRYEMKCSCGSRACRKVITEDDWMIPELQRRYDGYFQLYLQKCIENSRPISRSVIQ